MPASRRALATTLAPRSWPSRPGLAITIRIGRRSPVIGQLLGGEAVDLERLSRGDVAQADVAADQLPVPLPGVAVAAPAGQPEADHVPVAEVDRGLAPDLVGALGVGVDDGAAERPGTAAEEPEGREAVPLGEVGELDLLAQDADVAADAEAAPVAPGPARVGQVLEALDDHRGALLHRLDRDVGGVVGRGHAVAAVPGGAGPGAAVDQLVADEAAAAARVDGPEGGVAEVADGGGDRLGQGRGQRPQDDLEDTR